MSCHGSWCKLEITHQAEYCPCKYSGSKTSAIQQEDASNVSEIGKGSHAIDLSNKDVIIKMIANSLKYEPAPNVF